MIQSKRIGLTGGIASGKSTVTAFLREWGYTVVDSDAINHMLMQKGQSLYEAIVSRFGKAILDPHGAIDRKKLGEQVFGDETARKALNAIAHPLIYARVKEEMDGASGDLVFADIPLLFETEESAKCLHLEAVWLVVTDEKRQIQRLQKRDGLNHEDAIARIKAQMPQEEKIKRADVVIENSGSLEDLKRTLCQLLKREKEKQ